MLTDNQYMTIILAETMTNGDPIVVPILPMWWQMCLDRGKTGRLAYLYTKQAVLRYLLGIAKRRRDITIGVNMIKANQLFTNALAELKDWNDWIAKEDVMLGVPIITTHTPRMTHGQTDAVLDALEFAREINPFLDAQLEFGGEWVY